MYFSEGLDGETFADDDITPRPLRIIKRECTTVSDFSFARDFSASDIFHQNTGKPMSMSSDCIVDNDNGLSRGCAKSRRQAPIQNAKRQIFPQTLSHASNALHVPKQRRTNLKTTRVSSVLGGVVGDTLSHSSARFRDNSPRRSASKTMGQNSGIGDSVQAIAPASHRAVTTGSLGDECLLRPFTERPASPTAPKPLLTSNRSRAVTTDCVIQGGSDLAALQHHKLGRSRVQPSLRHRLFSRVMHGVGGKANVSQAASERETPARRLHCNNFDNLEPPQSAHIGRPRPASASSAETASTFAGGIDLALAAFPTPPKSTVTSPTTMSSFETTSAGSVVSRVLSRPPNVAVPSVQLAVIPEFNELELGCGQSLFVAVEITGDVGVIDRVSDVVPQAKGLDVAIVIDSS